MSVRKTVKTITLNGSQLTPGGEASIPVTDGSYEAMDNLDGSIDHKFNPERESATFPIAMDDDARKVIVDSAKVVGWSTTSTFRDGSTVQISNCSIVSIPQLDGDGVAEVEIHGSVRWL
jgi:hypothetical protein